MSNNINDKMKEVVKKSTFNNNQSSTPINATNKKKDTINFNNVIKNLSTSPNTKPWYKKKASIIGMSSTLGVGVLATAIAVPIVLTSKPSSTTVVPPPIVLPPYQQDIVDAFNAKPLTEKISTYNKLALDNNSNILNHFLLNGGFANFLTTNVEISTENVNIFNNFLAFIQTIKMNPDFNSGNFVTITNFTSANNINYKDQFLNIRPAGGPGLGDNSTYPPAFLMSSIYTNNIFLTSTLYSFVSDYIKDVTITSDFTINMSFIKIDTIQNYFAKVIETSAKTTHFIYKQDVVLNNSTLFPNMQEYVKTTILNIV